MSAVDDLLKWLPSRDRFYDGPVGWLFGQQLIGSIKGILLYAAYGKKLDPRDWMDGSVFPAAGATESLQFWRDPERPPSDAEDVEQYWNERGEFWFDYIADSGDGATATYSVAYLCACDLSVESLAEDGLRRVPTVRTAAGNPSKSTARMLPRGQFLLVGGDTSYHVSDYITLANRFQRPFQWAYEDLGRDGLRQEPNRPLFGIPGNHDYYDQLDGFRRQFRRPIKPEPLRGAPPKPNPSLLTPQLSLPGYVRYQEASYVALQLPFDWWLWGLDTELGQVDPRQEQFFRGLRRTAAGSETAAPKKLIVATCAPSTVFGKVASLNDAKAYDAFVQLGLSTPFRAQAKDGRVTPPGDAQLNPGECRIDLSGDVHHYARYWGPQQPGNPARPGSGKAAPAATSYASVVSGLGGAFHHPTRTYLGEVQEQALYPSVKASTHAVADRMLRVRHIARGGFVWLAGAVVAFVITFAASVPQSSRQIVNNFFLVKQLGLSRASSSPVTPTTLPLQSGQPRLVPKVTPAYAAVLSRDIEWVPPPLTSLACSDEDRDRIQKSSAPAYFYWPCRVPWPRDYWLGLTAFTVAPAILVAITFSRRVFKVTARQRSLGADQKGVIRAGSASTAQRLARADTEMDAKPQAAVWMATAVATAALVAGLASMRPYRDYITPFGNSVVTFGMLVWMAATLTLSLRYSEFLFKRARKAAVKSLDWAPIWVLPIAGLSGGAFGLWSFGKNNLPALLTSDIIFIVVCLGGAIGLVALPFVAGGELLETRPRWFKAIGSLAIGSWHALLQLAVPFMLIRRGGWLTLVAAGALMLCFGRIGSWLMKRDRPKALTLTWIAYGFLLLTCPYWTTIPWLSLDGRLHIAPFGLNASGALAGLGLAVGAAVVGAIASCSLFGWYLAVCFMFNGHNNEVGGASRLEDFKGFLRICLRQDSATVYAVAVDQPVTDGRNLCPRIVDVFTVRCKESGDDRAEATP